MKRVIIVLLVTLLTTVHAVAVTLSFNQNWAYQLGDVPHGEQVVFDDSAWVPVTIPHTLAMEKKYLGSNNYKGIGWYRRYFVLEPKFQGQRINLDFEGVMIDCDVFLNGEKFTTHHGGYLGFSVDITDKVKFGTSNLLAVRVSNEDDSETPPGKPEHELDFHYYGGIYRNVCLRIQNPLRITSPLQADQVAGGGVFVTYPKVGADEALVHVKTNVANDRSINATFSLRTSLIDTAGQTVGSGTLDGVPLQSGQNVHLQQDVAVRNPKLWDPDHPTLYTLVSEVVEAGATVDSLKTRVGIRRIEFTPDGFYINGEKLYIRGGNRHQQYQNIGDAAPDSMQRRDALGLKEDGFNAVRSHYPFAPAFLDACDALGVLVIESQPGWQFWNKSQTFFDATVRDVRQMIRRDRNRPGVFLWETTLNETSVPDFWKKAVTTAAHEEYPGDQTYVSCDGSSPYYNVGYKIVYRDANWKDWDPKKPFITREWGDWEGPSKALRSDGEQAMIRQVIYRQIYLNGDGYDDWGGLDSCERIAGMFLWSWMDHTRGGNNTTASCGAVDINRYPKFCNYWLRSMTDAHNAAYGLMVFIASYNQPPGPEKEITFTSRYHNRPGSWAVPWSNTDVMVFSNCDNVRLFQNDKLIEEATRASNAATAPAIARKGGSPYYVFKLPSWEPGTLKAEASLNGKVVATHEVRTPEAASAVQIEPAAMGMPLVADGSDLVPIYFKIVDKNGTLVPDAANIIKIAVEGEASLVGKGIARLEVEQQKVEAGLGFAYVRSSAAAGKILITAESPGLANGVKELVSVPASASFVPDGTHTKWSHDASQFESAIATSKAASQEREYQQRAIPVDQIESITASCPSIVGRGTDQLIDGKTDFGTGWLADTQALPQSVTFAFKTPQRISGAKIFWEKDSTWYVYDLKTSLDGQTWNKVVDSKTVTGSESRVEQFIQKQNGVRFLRVTIKDVKTGTPSVAIGLAEVRFYD